MGETLAQKKKPNKYIMVSILLPGTFIAILNQTLLSTALPTMMVDLDISENTAQWLMTIFMLVNGIMIPITAFLMETYTTRQLFLTAMGVFTAGTVICAIAPNFPILMVGRIVQAAAAGIMMPLIMTVFLLIFPVDKRGVAMGTVGLVISFAPAIGPTLSGWLLEHYHWRSLFYVILPLAIIDFIFTYFFLQNITKRTFPKVDVLSIILSTIGFGGILYGFSSAGNYGWSNPFVILSLVVGSITLLIFILRQLKLLEPILEFRVFKNPVFTLATAIGMIAFINLIGSETILPLYMQNMAGFTPLDSGLVILPGALIMGFMSPITGRIFDKVGARWLVVTGMGLLTITTLFYTQLTPDTTYAYLAIVFGIRMFGIAMVLMPATTAGLNQLSNKLIPHGTAMNNTMRQIAASVGTALLVTVMTSTAIATGPSATAIEEIRGVNISFYVAAAISFVGFVMAFYIRDPRFAKRKA